MKVLTIALLATLTYGCSSTVPKPRSAKDRKYKAGTYAQPTSVSDGSIWEDTSRGLFADFRATNVGDLVTIRIDESPQASGDADTNLERDSNISMGIPHMLGLMNALQRNYPDIEPEKLLELASSTDFRGNGSTTRQSRLRASVTARVKQVMPNGDLFVEGRKDLHVNDEKLFLYISGLIRAEDIQNDNSVRSSQLADAEVEFTGQGVLSDNQRQGWLTRLLQSVNPF